MAYGPEVVETVCAGIELGMTWEMAAANAGVSVRQVHRWRKMSGMSARFRQAEAQGAMRLARSAHAGATESQDVTTVDEDWRRDDDTGELVLVGRKVRTVTNPPSASLALTILTRRYPETFSERKFDAESTRRDLDAEDAERETDAQVMVPMPDEDPVAWAARRDALRAQVDDAGEED